MADCMNAYRENGPKFPETCPGARASSAGSQLSPLNTIKRASASPVPVPVPVPVALRVGMALNPQGQEPRAGLAWLAVRGRMTA